MRWLAVLALLVPVGAVAADVPPWVGVWTAEPEWCEFAHRIGSHDPAPVELTSTEFLGYENSCAIARVDQIGGLDAWRFVLSCQSEGSTYDEEMLGLMEGRDLLWLLWGYGEPVGFRRCGG